MNYLAKEISAEVVELIHHYGFDLGDYSLHSLVDYWMHQYPAPWIRLATIEALYQGRYKAISIEQILNLWRRRTRVVYHFNSEFERMISLRPMVSAATIASSPQPEASPAPANAAEPNSSKNSADERGKNPLPAASQFSEAFTASDLAARLDWQTASHLMNEMRSGSLFQAIDSGEIRRATTSEPLPIDQFTPTLEASDFYWRLKAVVQAMATSPAEEIGRRN